LIDPRGPFASTCPTRELLDQLADKWAMLVLIALKDGPLRFNALKRCLEGVSQKVLSGTLRKLVRNGLLSRTVEPTVPVTVEYALTPLGLSLVDLMEPIRLWAMHHIRDVETAREAHDIATR
jgi:DNA-binding HxlR family transcriptional regulator